jgi:quercetin dioxygenase-like cupin family protein
MHRLLSFAAALTVSLAGLPAAAQEAALAKPNLLLREVVAGMPKGDRQEVRVLTATLNPGDKTPFHTHRFPVTAYVIEGAFTLEMEGRAPVVIKAGESMVEPANVKMTGYNRATAPLKILIFYVSDPDTPFLDPVHPAH